MDVTTPEAAEVTSVVEVRLPEATSGMTEDTAIEACTRAAAPLPARFFIPFYAVVPNHQRSPGWEVR